ncbi:hypothetical protein B0T26DRAFT_721229 [Lasiosphaeria miniovina]|uniref:C2H2-type domain-containing protein n=1 Tax=Lasiosphaeria miniovina TaxID=1954250 RepID=A0AA40DMP0_9PEZI|nr:uncharacterized protein B0T26DRAFT_721229 [Lasiosphaeria miniovina]KAK0709339.1 hypothetical protein B0T26DRAFT_721229 [Lasiosphaeria miniovina]
MLRIRCPYRARNPRRFNVREHQGCAMTYFTLMSDLRQHVVKKHARDDTSMYSCARCNEIFATKSEQETHVKRAEGCPSRALDPEDGVDGETIMRILDRHRETTKSGGEILVEKQWAELWMLIFHNDDPCAIPSYKYHAVMEDCEFAFEWKGLAPILADALQRELGLGGNDETTQLLHRILLEHLEMVVKACQEKACALQYANRARMSNTTTTNHNRPGGGGGGQRRSEVISVLHSLMGQFSPRDSGIGTETSSNRASEWLSLANMHGGNNNNSNNNNNSAQSPILHRPPSQLQYQPHYPSPGGFHGDRASFAPIPVPAHEVVPLTPENLARNEAAAMMGSGETAYFAIRAGLASPLDVGQQFPSPSNGAGYPPPPYVVGGNARAQLYGQQQQQVYHAAQGFGQPGVGQQPRLHILDEAQAVQFSAGAAGNSSGSRDSYGSYSARYSRSQHPPAPAQSQHFLSQQQQQQQQYHAAANFGFGGQGVHATALPHAGGHSMPLVESGFAAAVPGVVCTGNPNMI